MQDEHTLLLKLEKLLECDVCNTTLSEPRALRLCDHILCLSCLEPLIKTSPACPICQKSIDLDDLEPDRRISNLLAYLDKIKQTVLDHQLTPLELSMLGIQSFKKRSHSPVVEEGEEEEVDELESEFSDGPFKKRLKAQLSEEDPVGLNSDPSVPGATLGLSSAEQTQESKLDEEEQEQDEQATATVQTIAEVSVVDDGGSTALKDQWQCTECDYRNAPYIQTCGVCHAFRANITPSAPTETVPSQEEEEEERQETYELTVATDNPPVDITQPVQAANKDTPTTSKEAHILYTGLTPEDEKALEKMKREAEKSRLKIFIHYQMREFHEITHVVTSVNQQRLCKRTMKYLQGILAGKWIVDPEWLLDSVKENQWQTEEDYEVQGDHLSGVTHAPMKGRERMHTPLFHAFSFYLNGEFSGKHNKNDLLILCRTGGAKIMTRKPTTVDKDTTLVVIVPEGYKRKKASAWLDDYPVKDPVWLIQCISTFEITI